MSHGSFAIIYVSIYIMRIYEIVRRNFMEDDKYDMYSTYTSNNTNDEDAEATRRRDVSRVNIVFLIIVVLPELLVMLGIGRLLTGNTAQIVFSQAVYVLPVLAYLIFFKKSTEPCRFNKLRVSDFLLCILLYICLFPVLALLNSISLLYSSNTISGVISGISNEIPYWLGIITIAIVPAFCEELTYRGVFYNTYRKVNPLGAILLSGAMFGLLHGNLNQITYAVALGIAFSLIVEATDSIFSTMLIHCLVNSFSTTLMYLIPKAIDYLNRLMQEAKAAGDTQTVDLLRSMLGSEDISVESVMGAARDSYTTADVLISIRAYLMPALIGGILGFFLFRFIARRCGRWEHICDIFKNPQKNGKLFTWPLIAAIVILISIIVLNELIARGIISFI